MLSELLKLLTVPGFRDGTSPPEEWIHINFYDGGLGDHVCRLPAIKYLLEEYPFLNLTVHCPVFFVDFAKKAIPKVNWRGYQKNNKLQMSRPAINAGSVDGVSSLRTHLVDHAFARIVDRQVGIERKNYIQVSHRDVDLSKFKLPSKYVVVTTGYTAEVRELIPSVVNEIVDFIKQAGVDVVFLGSREATVGAGVGNLKGAFSADIDFTAGVDLRDSTSLIEAHAIIANAGAIVGLDNGLLHLAGCTETPIVAGFTTVEPEYRIPYRHDKLGWNTYVVTPPTSLACRFCQSNMNFVYDFDFRKCYYKDYVCTKQATAAPYIEHLRALL